MPVEVDLETLAEQAAGCRACGLWRDATQTVFGEGPPAARLMLVGEQPGDKEDVEGVPFVGPAGRTMDDALVEAGLDRSELYVTNAVKHFKFRRSGKRRIHAAPNRTEVVACHGWLAAELEVIDPAVVVALGAIAGQALLGPAFRVGTARGRKLELDGRAVVATIHPSAVLRTRGSEAREEAFGGLVEDLRQAAALAAARAS